MSRWGLTGTLKLEEGLDQAAKQINKLGILLGAPLQNEVDHTDGAVRIADREQLGKVVARNNNCPHRLANAQRFLGVAVRQNSSAELEGIEIKHHTICVQLTQVERLLYLDKANELGYNSTQCGANKTLAATRDQVSDSDRNLQRIRKELLMLCSHCSLDDSMVSPEARAQAVQAERAAQLEAAIARSQLLVQQLECVRRCSDPRRTVGLFWNEVGRHAARRHFPGGEVGASPTSMAGAPGAPSSSSSGAAAASSSSSVAGAGGATSSSAAAAAPQISGDHHRNPGLVAFLRPLLGHPAPEVQAVGQRLLEEAMSTNPQTQYPTLFSSAFAAAAVEKHTSNRTDLKAAFRLKGGSPCEVPLMEKLGKILKQDNRKGIKTELDAETGDPVATARDSMVRLLADEITKVTAAFQFSQFMSVR